MWRCMFAVYMYTVKFVDFPSAFVYPAYVESSEYLRDIHGILKAHSYWMYQLVYIISYCIILHILLLTFCILLCAAHQRA